MKQSTDSVAAKPWYREPWPWVAIAIPGAAVIMGMITLYLALTNPDYVVVDDAEYKEIRSELKAQSAEPAKDSDGDG